MAQLERREPVHVTLLGRNMRAAAAFPPTSCSGATLVLKLTNERGNGRHDTLFHFMHQHKSSSDPFSNNVLCTSDKTERDKSPSVTAKIEAINTACKYNRRVVVTSAPAAAYNDAKGNYNTVILYNKTKNKTKITHC